MEKGDAQRKQWDIDDARLKAQSEARERALRGEESPEQAHSEEEEVQKPVINKMTDEQQEKYQLHK